MDVGGYKNNCEGFVKNLIYPMSINKERITTNQDVHTTLVRILSFLLFFFWQ